MKPMKRRFTTENKKNLPDSEKSTKEPRKSKDMAAMNKSAPAKRKTRQNDVCDCLQDDCPGCHCM